MIEAIIFALGACVFVFGFDKYLDLINHREEREARLKMMRAADVAAIADKQAEMEKVMDGAFRQHEKRICELEMAGVPRPPRTRP